MTDFPLLDALEQRSEAMRRHYQTIGASGSPGSREAQRKVRELTHEGLAEAVRCRGTGWRTAMRG